MKAYRSSSSLSATPPPVEAIGASVASGEGAPLDHRLVSERARALWRERGCPMGRDEEIWLEAERELSGVGRSLGVAGAPKTEGGANRGGGIGGTIAATRARRSRVA